MDSTPPPISDNPQELDLSLRHTAAHKALNAAIMAWRDAPPLSLKRRRAAGAVMPAWGAVFAVRVEWVAYDPTFAAAASPESCAMYARAWCKEHSIALPAWAAPRNDSVALFDIAA